ncbi:hypothetical protein ACIPPN_30010 [Streptomyces diastaticus]|uniref:hypothetical protein n=1 Tax=Streptomyces diastaticus TaxID=1956 RepID=UPI00365C699D
MRTTVYVCATCIVVSDADTLRATRALRDAHRAAAHSGTPASDDVLTPDQLHADTPPAHDAVRLAPALREALVLAVLVLCGGASGALLHDLIAALV